VSVVERCLAVCLTALALAACGAGTTATINAGNITVNVNSGANGGGTGNPTDPLNVFFGTTQTFVPTPKQGLEIISNSGTTTGLEANPAATFERTSSGFNLVTNSETVRFDTRSGSSHNTGTLTYSNCITCNAGSATTAYTVTFNDARSTNLSLSTYGTWMRTEGTATPARYGVFAFGATTTTSAQMPTTGTGTFVGRATGFFDTAGSDSDVSFSGDITVSANFAGRTLGAVINGVTTRSVNSSSTGTMGNIVLGGGVISGAFFAGTAAGVAGGSTDVGGLTGPFAGAFYGASASEASGTFTLSGTTARVIGSFGTRR
jgi:hypothetical protein